MKALLKGPGHQGLECQPKAHEHLWTVGASEGFWAGEDHEQSFSVQEEGNCDSQEKRE